MTLKKNLCRCHYISLFVDEIILKSIFRLRLRNVYLQTYSQWNLYMAVSSSMSFHAESNLIPYPKKVSEIVLPESRGTASIEQNAVAFIIKLAVQSHRTA